MEMGRGIGRDVGRPGIEIGSGLDAAGAEEDPPRGSDRPGIERGGRPGIEIGRPVGRPMGRLIGSEVGNPGIEIGNEVGKPGILIGNEVGMGRAAVTG